MRRFRIGLGRLWHESNTFSPRETGIECFERYEGGVRTGSLVLGQKGRQDELTGMMEVFDRENDVQIVPLMSAAALPSGSVSRGTAERLEGTLRERLRTAAPLDGVCFALHGAMSAESIPDFDGHIMRVIREETNHDTRLVASLDCHAVVTRRMVESADALVAYRTHPHTDLVETGARAARILLDTLRGNIHPVMRSVKVPLMFPPPDAGTRSGALKQLFGTFIEWDSIPGVVACSFCPGFPWQNVPEQGATAIAVTNNDPALASRLAHKLAGAAWNAREELMPEPMHPPADAIRIAGRSPHAPVILTDSADTVGGGAPGDNTTLLEALIRHRKCVDGLIATHLPSPAAVARLKDCQIGRIVTVEVGGEGDRAFCQPLSVSGELFALEQGPIRDDGGFGTEPFVATGTIACLAIDNLRLVLTERVVMGPQPSLFRKVGIDPFTVKVVALKTGVGYKATFGVVATEVVRCDCPGAVSYDLRRYEYKSVSRPIFPLDREMTWLGSNDAFVSVPHQPERAVTPCN